MDARKHHRRTGKDVRWLTVSLSSWPWIRTLLWKPSNSLPSKRCLPPAFLSHMIEAFIYQRRVRYAVMSHVGPEVVKLSNSLPNPKDLEKARLALGSGQQRTPGMLPSPAGTASTNGTPNNQETGTPNPTNSESDSASSSQLPAPTLPPAVTVPLTASVPQPLIWDIRDVVESQNRAAVAMQTAHQHLTLSGMREHFPRTFGRMVYSTLTAQDEHEPDMEDDDGELFWPGQCVTGDGLGWLCNMGRAMVKEFGNEFGYKGMDGIIPKPDDERSMLLSSGFRS